MRFFIAVILVFTFTFNVNSIEIEIVKSTKNSDKLLLDIMYLEDIQNEKIRIMNGVKDKHYRLLSKSIWKNGDIIIDTVFYSENPYKIGELTKDTLELTFIAKKEDDSSTFVFRANDVKFKRKFNVIKNNKNSYSLRNTQNVEKSFEYKEQAIVALYTLPYQDPKFPDIYHYCRLEVGGIPPEKWPEEYGVEHIIIFYIEFY